MNTRLIQKRENCGLSRKELAVSIEVSISTIEKVEKGTRRASPDLALKWGRKIGIKETQLFKYFFINKSDIMSCGDGNEPLQPTG
ncbi:MAG: helix-turn-helix transcriptional regulator [Veillonellales bacterium]